MAINWFPGHMNKARRLIRETMGRVDLVLEILDARLPHSSENPLVAALRGDVPCIKLLNKTDLADPMVTAAWLEHLQAQPGVLAFTHEWKQPLKAHRILKMGETLLRPGRSKHKPITAMVLGVPNVGKSTVINTLMGRKVAKVSNKPAVTKQQQRVELTPSFVLLDTPGFLWPRLDPPECGYRLAVSGAIAPTAFDFEDIATFAAGWLLRDYPGRTAERYNLEALPATATELLDLIAARRGCIGKGAVVDRPKVAELLIREIRGGQIGRLSFEQPAAARGHRRGEDEERAPAAVGDTASG